MKGYKGWYFESWRHSLAAKGISSGMKKSFKLRDVLSAGAMGAREVERRAGVARAAAQTMKVPGTESAFLTAEERKKAAQKRMELALGMRERRFQEARRYMQDFPPARGESLKNYLKRLRGEMGEGVWQAWALGGEEESFRFVDVNGNVATRKGPMTVGDYVEFVLRRDADYQKYRSEAEKAEAEADPSGNRIPNPSAAKRTGKEEMEEAMAEVRAEQNRVVKSMKIGTTGINPEDTTINFVFEDGGMKTWTYGEMKDKLKTQFGPNLSKAKDWVNDPNVEADTEARNFLNSIIDDIRSGG